jgi:transmembrane protein 216
MDKSGNAGDTPVSSLPFQMLLYFDEIFLLIYAIVGIFTFIYKEYSLTYPPYTLGPELAFFVVFCLVMWFRVHLGSMGNKGERLSAVAWFILITIPGILGVLFFMLMQTYVLVADLIINVFLIAFVGGEGALAILHLLKLKKLSQSGQLNG